MTTEKNDKPFYKKWWGITLLVLFWPISLLWYIWKFSNWNQAVKIGASVGVFILVAISTANMNQSNQQVAQKEQERGTQTATQEKAVTEPAPAPQPPKPQSWSDGTYEVGRDIPTGTYVANGNGCYWQISRDSNGSDIVGNNFGDGQQIVTLDTPGTFFKVGTCPFTART